MINEADINKIKFDIDEKGFSKIYCIVNELECQSSAGSEAMLITYPKYKIIELAVYDVQNALFELMNYINNPDNYSKESSVNYTVNKNIINGASAYNKSIDTYVASKSDENGMRMPSLIYGHESIITDIGTDEIIKADIQSPIAIKYTNRLYYDNAYHSEYIPSIGWRYKELDSEYIVDGIKYKYITSDWYILKCKKAPKNQHALLKINTNSPYFTNINDAASYISCLV